MFLPALSALHWHVLQLTLRNRRNTFAREHPLSIFDAILKFAARLSGREWDGEVFFVPHASPGSIVRKGREYRLQLVFPHAGADDAQYFADNVVQWLRDPANNFDVIACGPPVERSVAMVENEWRIAQGVGGKVPDEVCLDFLTPLTFTPADSRRRWLLDTQALLQLLTNRLARLYGAALQPECVGLCDVARDLSVLPWFWDYVEFRHRSRSGKGERFINGMTGPLYLRGNLEPVLPLLLACTELGAGRRLSAGQGAFRLEVERPWFDEQLAEPLLYQKAWEDTDIASDNAPPGDNGAERPEKLLMDIRERVLDESYTFSAAKAFTIPKRSGGQRVAANLEPEDKVVHRLLTSLLTPGLDRSFEPQSVAFRKGRSRDAARAMITEAVREGCSHVLEADIAAFFDMIDWDVLAQRLDAVVPRADVLVRRLVDAAVRMPLAGAEGPIPRERGVLQGSPLSPLLSNLYLDGFDEEMARHGFRLVRYADDFVILTRSEEEATAALEAAREALSALGLWMNDAKTGIHDVWDGFRFLGFSFDGATDGNILVDAALRRPLFVRHQYAFIGLEGDSVEVRRNGEVLGRAPLRRVGELMIYGNGGISTRLVQKCAAEGIPVSFCTPLGWHVGTLRPDSRAWFDRITAHGMRHARMGQRQRGEVAAALVAAKVDNAMMWLRTRLGKNGAALAAQGREVLEALAATEDAGRAMGLEGGFARKVFPAVNGLVRNEAFQSVARVPRRKPDRWNALLDFAYSQLFTRLNVLLRGEGLNPYLGFLHSPADRYESLVADLQEPFRHRMDRWAVNVVNCGVVRPEAFACEGGKWRMVSGTLDKLLHAFEDELDTRMAGDEATLREQLITQTMHVRQWACEDGPFLICRRGGWGVGGHPPSGGQLLPFSEGQSNG